MSESSYQEGRRYAAANGHELAPCDAYIEEKHGGGAGVRDYFLKGFVVEKAAWPFSPPVDLPMTRIALYARRSSDLQSAASTGDQLRICRQYAERQGWQIVESYADEAISGATMMRPGLQSLLADASEGKIDVIVTEALDRIARDQEHIANIFKRLTFLE